jgi:hypothetical protein
LGKGLGEVQEIMRKGEETCGLGWISLGDPKSRFGSAEKEKEGG